jgi:NAD(P)-dependent dehydrogenase (short-subunit alcohol dehydrogenase family)
MAGFPSFQMLSGARLLVIGGSSGIGLATARRAGAEGARITIASRNADRMDAARAQIGTGCETHVLDMTDAGAVDRFFDAHPPFDHVVVTAAALASGRVRDLPPATARATFESKFWGPYTVARAARIVDDGSLTLVSGAAARRPRAARAPVAAACAAIEALTRVLAAEFAPVRVNCVAPGLVDTPMLRAAIPPGGPPPSQPVARWGAADEIAFQILACACNPYMTGAVIDVDGGAFVG